jgi:hypothetical protein
MKETLSRRYVLILVGLALLILIVGGLLRPKKPVAQPPSPSDTASLDRLVQREDLRRMADFLARSAASVADKVVYVRDRRASGVIWERQGQAITTMTSAGEPRAPLLLASTNSTQAPVALAAAAPVDGRWIVIVGRSPDGKLQWTAGLGGGTRPAVCDGLNYSEILINSPLPNPLAGAGAFDLDGSLAGIVVNCSGSLHVAAAAGISSLLAAASTPGRQLMSRFGLRVSPLPDGLRPILKTPAGLLVAELWYGTLADDAGLAAGDVIVAAANQPVSTAGELWKRLASEDAAPVPLEVVRNGRKTQIVLNAPPPTGASPSLGVRLEPPPRTLASVSILPNTPAYAAGLRSGDRILQLGALRNPTAAALRRRLSAHADAPLFLVYRRGPVERAVTVTP